MAIDAAALLAIHNVLNLSLGVFASRLDEALFPVPCKSVPLHNTAGWIVQFPFHLPDRIATITDHVAPLNLVRAIELPKRAGLKRSHHSRTCCAFGIAEEVTGEGRFYETRKLFLTWRPEHKEHGFVAEDRACRVA